MHKNNDQAGTNLLAEALAVFDLMLVGCSLQCFGDYQNGDGETIGPRMDALHAALRGQQAPIQSAELAELRKLASDALHGNGPSSVIDFAYSKFNEAANPATILRLLDALVAPAHALTDAEIEEMWDAQWSYHGHEPCKLGHVEFARAIAAHLARKG